MAVGEVVYAKNVGDKDLVWKWNNQKYKLPVGGVGIIPWECMQLYMGNPDAMDIDDRRRYRTDELFRLYFKHGAHDGNPELWEKNKPRVECTTLLDERIITIVDDPAGDHISPDVSTRAQERLMLERVAQLEAELKSLKRAGQLQERQDAATSAGVQVTEDTDGKPQPIEQVIQTFQGDVPTGQRTEGVRAVTEDVPNRPKAGIINE